MRPPSRVLIVDANIVLSCALGLRAGEVLEFVGQRRILAISQRAVEEVIGVSGRLADEGQPSAVLAPKLVDALSVVAHEQYAQLIPEAAKTLMLAPASRNGNSADAHVLALAWQAEADIWSHDRDFAGTGWPSWSSANLRAALARETENPNP
ncbi:PIN domain-containing protein [Bosea caraganae]|uniref:PIN domain-containing protein n=1 Tax=Bosea caraganae TaxID=2763117 RepID=UPI0015F03D07|nr:PIN domain-containing protein [Bosea caraganae]